MSAYKMQWRRLLPIVRQVHNQGPRCQPVSRCSWWWPWVSGLQGKTFVRSTWQQRKQQHLFLQNYFHDPFTIGKMTGVNVLPGPMSPSPVTPVPLWALPDTTFKKCHVRLYSTKPPSVPSTPTDENHNLTKPLTPNGDKDGKSVVQVEASGETKEEKMSLVQKFKLMYKQYWYVLIPVHVVTSIVWYGSFFIAAKSGVDIVPIMEKLGAGEKILSHLQNSNAGYYAIAYAMYKIATPARYTVTIGGTTISINYLKKHGYIKPVPSSEKLKEMYEGKKEELIEKKDEIKEKYQERKEEMVGKYQEKKDELVEKYQERRDSIIDKVTDKREEFRDRTDEIRERVAEKKEELKDKIEESKDKLDNLKKSVRKKR